MLSIEACNKYQCLLHLRTKENPTFFFTGTCTVMGFHFSNNVVALMMNPTALCSFPQDQP